MYSMIQEAESVTTQDGYLSQVSRFLRVDESALRRDYGQFKKRKRYPIQVFCLKRMILRY